jgi:hypothetical protein
MEDEDLGHVISVSIQKSHVAHVEDCREDDADVHNMKPTFTDTYKPYPCPMVPPFCSE